MSGPSSSGYSMEPTEKRVSPPKAVVDSTPLQAAMDKNRESLKVKLLVRRSQSQLVEQNILPPLKTSPAIHEQRKLLERAKTGDLLKAKIQQRPNRQELERRHILESHEGHIDPSLADKYRMLEKAILVDQLNSKISHRPGPLELIEKNILHTNEPIERIVKEGLVPFKVGSDEDNKTSNFLSFEDDSQSSESDLFQKTVQVQPEVVFKKEPEAEVDSTSLESQTFETLQTPTGVINISLVPSTSNVSVATFKIQSGEIPAPPPPPKLELITYHVKPILQTQVKGLINTHTQSFLPIQISESPVNNVNTILSPPNLLQAQPQTSVVNQHVSSFLQNNQNQKYSAPGKEKNRKKCKNKVVSKRAIKFHEYKGPTNKNSCSSSSTATPIKKAGETNFELIMQQKCLLEYLEGIYKNPQAIQTAKPDSDSNMHVTKTMKIETAPDSYSEDKDGKMKSFTKPHVMIFPSKPHQTSNNTNINNVNMAVMETIKDVSDVSKLSKMKVSELKAYLKRINLPVSGPKPLLIERLKPYLPLKPLDDNDDASVSSNVISEGNDVYNASVHSVSSTESEMDNMEALVSSSSKDEDLNIVVEQQRKIEELQRKLQESQQQLEQMKQHTVPAVSQPINQTTVVYDPQFPMDQIPAVFVVGVAEPHKVTNEDAAQVDLSTAENDSQILLEAVSNSNVDVSSEVDKQQTTNKDILATSPIPMSQDITDVLEILLKSGEWPEISDVKLDDNFPQSSNEAANISNNHMLSPKAFIDSFTNNNGLSEQDQFNVNSILSPMLQGETLDKILDTVSAPSSTILNESFSTNFNNQPSLEFPMEIEEDIVNPDFNRNFNQEFIDSQPHQNIIQPYDFNGLKMDNCDTKYNVKSSQVGESPQSADMKTEFPMHQKSPTKNGLIGNFDHDLFDTLKNNSINNNSINGMNELFLIPQDHTKFSKDDNRSLINNLHLTNNYDIFNMGLDNTPINMDFEDLQISSFDSACRGGNFNSSIFNDDSSMTCDL